MEEFLHPSDDLNDPLPPEPQALLDRFKAYAVWHPRLLQARKQVLDTIWEPADVVYTVVCGPSGVGKSKLAEVLARRLNTPADPGRLSNGWREQHRKSIVDGTTAS
jgi:putative ribosome biogenesis GTPase RsgA